MDLFDGAVNTTRGRWVECTQENILAHDMVVRSRMGERAFTQAIKEAYESGGTPKMWIVEEDDGTQTPPEEGTT